jgi:hypothetical protein
MLRGRNIAPSDDVRARSPNLARHLIQDKGFSASVRKLCHAKGGDVDAPPKR